MTTSSPPREAKHPVPAHIADLACSPLALAADLAEHDGVREKGEALRNLDSLQEHLAVPANIERASRG